MSEHLVSFVVLNWNGLEDTLACLESIRKQTYKNYEIIVVDNGSVQEQKEELANISTEYTAIDIIKNDIFKYNNRISSLSIFRAEMIGRGSKK